MCEEKKLRRENRKTIRIERGKCVCTFKLIILEKIKRNGW